MAARRQVTYRFPTHTEVRYPDVAPQRGERVMRGKDDDWVVARVLRDAAGLEVVVCPRSCDYPRRTAHGLRRAP